MLSYLKLDPRKVIILGKESVAGLEVGTFQNIFGNELFIIQETLKLGLLGGKTSPFFWIYNMY